MAIITKALATANGQNDIVFALRNMAEVITGGNTIESIYNTMMNKYGYPFTASTVSAMTDQSKIYVYTGSETGYTAGNWYYYNGSAWVSGGVFNSQALSTDTSLTVSGAAADAKATGDAITSTRAEMSLFGVDDFLWDNHASPYIAGNGITYSVDAINKTVTVSGTASSTSFCRFYYNQSSIPAWLQKGKKYIAHMHTTTGARFSVGYYVDNGGSAIIVADTQSSAEFIIPAEATGIIIRIYVSSGNSANGVLRPFISESPSLSELQDEINKQPLINQGSLAIATDLDTKTDAGYYFISKNSQATPHSSNPIGNEYSLFCVYPSVNGGVMQTIFGIEVNKQYIRRYSPGQSAWTDWVSFFDDINYMKRLFLNLIPANTDFNDLTETGFAFINIGTTYANKPPVNGGVLVVYNTGTIVTQYAYGHKTVQSYVRRKISGTWSEWVGSQSRKSLKYLCIGNSGSQDMLSYVPFIMQNVAPDLDLTIGITYISGGTIDQQINAFDNDTLLTYDLCRAGSSAWSVYSNKTLKECLVAEDWDIISVQQASSYQMTWSYYANIPTLIDKIVTYVGTDNGDYKGHPIKVGYMAPQVRIASNTPDAQGKYPVIETPTTYSDYMTCVQRAMDEYPLEFAIMSGTAVQTARKETTLDQYGDAQFSDGTSGHMNADYTHLQEGIGCMVASYASTLFLLDLAGINNRSVLGEGTRPDVTWVNAKNIPGKNWSGSVVGVTDENCLIAQKCAIMAHKKPFEVSTIV